MAKKEPLRRPDSDQPNADQPDINPHDTQDPLPEIEETVQFETDVSRSEVDHNESTSDESVDPHATIESDRAEDQADFETLVPDGEAEDQHTTPGRTAGTLEIENVVERNDQTVRPNDKTVAMTDQTVSVGDEMDDAITPTPNKTVPLHDKTVPLHDKTVPLHEETVALNEETVAPSDHTVDLGDPSSAADQSNATSGDGSGITVRRGGKSDSDLDSSTVVELSGSSDRASILASPEIEQTVNPRELSDEDASEWNRSVGEGTDEPSVLPPAIDRTFSDTHFGRLRSVDVSRHKSTRDKTSDYRLVRKLGQGGMGDVFVARQASLDRLLALKLIKPLSGKRRNQLEIRGKLESVEEERRQQFLSEAIVTGDLEHPNIVPIHDVALTSNNELFYVMKRVVGTPWSEEINERNPDENLETLLKVADAIAFAHTRGVVHRDIKPENIMIGDFGVVMVMDWGLALPTSEYEKQNSIFSTSGLGGTPAFMAPEMATGPLNKIGPAADIYLLGATLYLIITGHAPHRAKNITECLIAVRDNKIQEAAEEHQGELLDIALKAMSTEPQDRYPDVESFQTAIRDYRAHVESNSLASRAQDDLEQGKRSESDHALSRATFRFEEALGSWDGNEKAREGLEDTRLLRADLACANENFELGLSLLDEADPAHDSRIKKLRAGLDERESRVKRLSFMKRSAAAMLAIIIVGGGWALYRIDAQRDIAVAAKESEEAAKLKEQDARVDADRQRVEAELARDDARTQRDMAKNEREKAEFARDDAQRQRDIAKEEREKAVIAKQDAEQARNVAEQERERAEYEEYVSKIGLAKARLERNEAVGAIRILDELRAKNPDAVKNNWEWQWLWRQANQAESVQQSDDGLSDMSVSRSGRRAVVALRNGGVDVLAIDDTGRVKNRRSMPVESSFGTRATAVALSRDGSRVAVGTEFGEIVVADLASDIEQARIVLATRELDRGDGTRSHDGGISDLEFTADDLLVSGSLDKTVRVWNASTGNELTSERACWHISPVRKIALSESSNSTATLAVAIADDANGQVALWKLRWRGERVDLQRDGTFKHKQPVSSVAISRGGRLVASGDRAGNVLVWNPETIPATNYASSIENAIRALESDKGSDNKSPGKRPGQPKSAPLIDTTSTPQLRLVSTGTGKSDPSKAHDDIVNTIRFSGDGKQLLTGADDNTLKLWNVASRRLDKTLKGHGGWVVAADFLHGQSDVVVSASRDKTVRSWLPNKYVGASLVQQLKRPGSDVENRETKAHSNEIWSASLSPDGTHVVTASSDHTARVMRIDPESMTFSDVARMSDEVLDEGSAFVAMSLQLDQQHRRLYVGSADSTVRVWHSELGIELGEATGTGLNASFAVAADGSHMLTGSSSPNYSALIWKLDPDGRRSPKLLHRLKEHDQAVTAFALSPTSKVAFTGDRSGFGIVWDVATGRRVGRPIEAVRGFRINGAEFSPDGRELLLAADDQQLTRVALNDGRILGRMNHNGFVTQLSLSPDGEHALTVSESKTEKQIDDSTTERRYLSSATLWDLRTEKGVVLDRVNIRRSGNQDSRNRHRITSARFGHRGKFVSVARSAAAGKPATIRVWQMADVRAAPTLVSANLRSGQDQDTARPRQTLQLPTRLGTPEVVLPVDGRSILTVNRDAAFTWDLATTRLIRSYRAHAALTEASFSFDGKFVATGSRSVKIWDAMTGKSLGKLESQSPLGGPVRTVQFAPRKLGATQYVFATGGDDGVARVWTWDPGDQRIRLQSRYGEENPENGIQCLRFSPDADRLVVVGNSGSARLWNLRQRDEPIEFDVPESVTCTCAAFSPTGGHVAVGSSDTEVRVWKIPETGNDVESPIMLSGHAEAVNDVKFVGETAGNLRVMTASSDDTARVWDPRIGSGQPQGREILSLRRHTGDVTSVDVTRDGGLMMTAGRDGAVILWPAK